MDRREAPPPTLTTQWHSPVLTDRHVKTMPAAEPDAQEPREQLIELPRRALDSGSLSDQDPGLLLGLAVAANLAVAPIQRCRAGLATPSVAQLVREDPALAARTFRRRAAIALDKLGKVARQHGKAL